ncbi:MAG TPA: C13 family peptidase [Burkholderiaceae bacterium]
MSETDLEVQPGEAAPVRGGRAPVRRWILQGARSVVFLRPDWTGLRATPLFLAGVCAANLAVVIATGRLFVAGPATFHWYLLGYGWFQAVLVAWGCWLASNGAAPRGDSPDTSVDAPAMLTMLWVQCLAFAVLAGIVYVPAWRGVGGLHWPTGALTYMPLLVHVAWMASAQIRVALGGTRAARPWPRAGLVLALLLALALDLAIPLRYWQADKAPQSTARAAEPAAVASAAASTPDGGPDATEDADAETDFPLLKLSQEMFEHQQRLLATQLDAIAPQRPGVVDMYAITFAPYADVDVFMRESAVVAGVMEQRFDTRGRTLQLVNNLKTTDTLPWATPLNLQRAIARMARRMDRDDDILFIHLTSHGGADARLAAEFFPLTVDELTPQALRRWLDEAHVRNRVISISACYSGSWIAPLADDDTLVMTAADADHTSYGCGSKSTLTFFGQAMYDEQLRHTWSFEEAHAASRKLIAQREKEAGKTDGYSNPQIRMGSRIRERLKALQARLAGSAAR